MTFKYLTWLRVLLVATFFVFVGSALCVVSLRILLPMNLLMNLFVIGMLVLILFTFALQKRTKFINSEKALAWLDRECERQAEFIDGLPLKYIWHWIFASAALSLLLELAMIRWQSSSIDFLAFFKNFGLFACFAGLGLGYSLSRVRQIPIFLVNVLIAWQVLMVVTLQAAGITHLLNKPPVLEQVTIGYTLMSTINVDYWMAVYLIMSFLFCLTALTFVPVGQVCGRLMNRTNSLYAYGANLLGSLFGVIVMATLSLLWTPPLVWFGICLLGCLLFTVYDAKTVIKSAVVSMSVLIVLGIPTLFAGGIVHSPYQVIEVTTENHGWSSIKAAGYYYQKVLDLSKPSCAAFPDLQRMADYYNLPYKIAPGVKNVLIMGAGAGNDVSAALRAGAEHVDAVEIDPAIAEFGRLKHPEKPYDDKRVHLVLGDARAFLRNTKEKYDLIVYALIDSHALSSSSSALRVDSYIYTVESFKDARSRLRPNGTLALSFVGVVPQLQQKVYLMLKSAFDQQEPLALFTNYDSSSSFFESANGVLNVPADLENRRVIKRTDLNNKDVSVDVSTDDWPFFYMPRRQFPFSYIPLVGLVLVFSYALISTLSGAKLRVNFLPFFWLGAGFMLVETKAITELGLQFGNTWSVTSIVVAAVMIMAFISNLAVSKLKIKNLTVPAILLILSLAGSAVVSSHGLPGLILPNINEWVMTAIITCPIIFSGIIFSILISEIEDLGGAISMNIFGALCGGVLEYGAMFMGYRALYVFAIIIYAISFISIVTSRKSALSVPTIGK
jgi:spermidine synthase